MSESVSWEIRSVSLISLRPDRPARVDVTLQRIAEGFARGVVTHEISGDLLPDSPLVTYWEERRPVTIVTGRCPTCHRVDREELWGEDERLL